MKWQRIISQHINVWNHMKNDKLIVKYIAAIE